MLEKMPDKLRMLVVGGGGREHAIVCKLAASPRVAQVFCSPGNAGIGEHATLVPIQATDIGALVEFATVERIDLTVVGPEAPLCAGIVDAFREKGLAIFGPTKAAAEIEGSKVFCAKIMKRHYIPHPKSVVCTDPEVTKVILERSTGPVVLKADGLAAGKGVIIAHTNDAARDAVDRIMVKREFGDAGKRIVIQEFLEGRECSAMAITDGTTVLPLALARDYKRAYDGDRGDNTGGMGAYSPLPDVSAVLENEILQTIIAPTIRAMANEGRPFTGVLYAGLMLTDDGPQVLEFNCRFGDPEIQAVLARLQSDFAEILWAAATGTLDELPPPQWSNDCAVCVVAAAEGYPGKPKKGNVIERVHATELEFPDVQILHAGTALDAAGHLIVAGGRVLNFVALGSTHQAARGRTYAALKYAIERSLWYRRDIAEGVGNPS